jgi:transposase
MQKLSITNKFFGCEKCVIEDIKVDKDKGECLVYVRPTKRFGLRCSLCLKPATYRDNLQRKAKYRTHNFGSFKVFLVTNSIRVYCKKCNSINVRAYPFVNHKSKFTKSVENEIAWFSLHASKNVVKRYLRVSWQTVGNIVSRVRNKIQITDLNQRFKGVKSIGIDETSHKKGHKYLTTIVNLENGQVLYVTDGYGKDVLEHVFRQLDKAILDNIDIVAADGARWIWSMVNMYLPNAKQAIDPFHVVSWSIEQLDIVRRELWRESYSKIKASNEILPAGSPRTKANTVEAKFTKSLKNSRYAVGKNPENLSDNQAEVLSYIAENNPKYYRAYRLKEGLRLVFKANNELEAKTRLDKWLSWAARCQIKQFKNLKDKIKRHYDKILTSIKFKANTSIVESINTKVKLFIRIAYGFRNIENLKDLIYLATSNPKPKLEWEQ